MMKRIEKHFQAFTERIVQPTYWLAVAITTVGYFAFARLLQDFLYRGFQPPRDLFSSFGEHFLWPEPLEIPLYFFAYLAVPLAAFAVEPAVRSIWQTVQRRGVKPVVVVLSGIAVFMFLVGGLASWNRIIGFIEQAFGYLQNEGGISTLWLLFTKRIFVTRLLFLSAVVVFVAVYVVGCWRSITLLPSPGAERIFSRWWFLVFPLLALLVFHPNFPVENHHFTYFIAPLNDQLHGKALLYETSTLYGVLLHYLLLAVFGLGMLPLSYPALSLLVAGVFFLFLAGWLAVLYSWLRTKSFAVLAVLSLYAVLFLFQTSPTRSAFHFPAMTPLRFWLVVPVFSLLLRSVKTGRRFPLLAAIGIAGMTPFWNVETGVSLAAATLVVALISDRGPVLRRVVRIGVTFFVATLGTFAAITAVNWAVYGQFPDWLRYLAEVRRFAQGIGVHPLPVVGLFEIFFGLSLAVVLTQFLRYRHSQTLDVPLLFLALYGAGGMIYYVGESTWQQLYLVSWPYIILVFALADRYFTAASLPSRQRLVTAAFAAALTIPLGLLAVKLPVELTNRDYQTITASFSNPPAEDLPLVRDAEYLKAHFPETRIAVFHLQDGKLLTYAGKVNLLSVYYSFNLYTKPEVAALADEVEKFQPRYVLVGRPEGTPQEDQRKRVDQLDYFRQMVGNDYTLDQRLETLDVLIRK